MATPVPSSFELAQLSAPESSGLGFSRSEGGLIITSRHSEPYLAGTMVTRPQVQDEFDDLEAFLFGAVQYSRRLDFIHPKHLIPRSYSATEFAALGWSGNANVSAWPDLHTAVVSGMPVGLVLKRGDRMSITEGTKNSLKMIDQDVIVSSVISQTIALSSRVPIGVFTVAAIVHFQNPVLRFMVVPDSIDNKLLADEMYPSLTLDFVEVLQ